jgi:hypothetical protein
MKVKFPSRLFAFNAGLFLIGSVLHAQTTTQLFGPINTRNSNSGAGWTTPYVFGSTTVSLTCPSGTTATLQGLGSDGNPSSKLLVDNNIIVTVSQGAVTSDPVNVCPVNATTLTDKGLFNNHCFDLSWESTANSYMGQNPDDFAATQGISPFAITAALQNPSFDMTKPISVTFSLDDEGGIEASSSVYLNTTCTVNGVTGPATVGGNPISGTGNQGTSQTFTFDSAPNKIVGFNYDVTGALPTLINNVDGATPQVADAPLDTTQFQPVYAPLTSFATSNCLVHDGEVLADGVTPACKLYTLTCQSPTDGTIKGANCPVSQQVNEVVQDTFDGPAFTLQNIVTPYGIFRQGIGFLMASEPWSGGNCTFDPSSGLSGLPCPLNLLTSFTGPGLFKSTGLTTNPNSTFISIYGVPEDFTLALLLGEWPGHWVNTRTPSVKFYTVAPNFTKGAYTLNGFHTVALPGASKYVPAPIQSLTYGTSTPDALPSPASQPIAGDTTLQTTANCSAIPFTAKSVPNFNPPVQQLSFASDGQYLLHYYAEDCAGTQELQFTQDQTGSWMTNFFTIEVNVDTIKPAVVGLAVPSPGSFKKGTTVYATYSCSDDPSGAGVVLCGTSIYGTETHYTTNVLKTKLDTGSLGSKSITIYALDGAGNLASSTVNYTVTK